MQTEDEDADVETGLDTDAEMAVGESLRRRRGNKEKRSAVRRRKKSSLGANGASGGGGGGGSSSKKHSKRRARRHSMPAFTLSDADGDETKWERLNRRLDAMRLLPRGSRYASQQIDLISKALAILRKTRASDGGGGGVERTNDENDELARLLSAVSL